MSARDEAVEVLAWSASRAGRPGLEVERLISVIKALLAEHTDVPTLPVNSDWQPLGMRVEGIWLTMKPGCPVAKCDWGTSVTSINTPDGRVDSASDALALLLGTIEHLREEHQAAYPWGDHADDDKRITLQLEPERAARLVEVLKSAGAHPSGLGSYEAANDANALAEDLAAQMERT